MNTPPLLLGATLAFWGWRSNLLGPAVLIGIVLEASRLIPWRWSVSPSQFKRFWWICVLLFFSLLTSLFISTSISYALLTTFQWLPLIFLPIVAAQIFSTTDRIGIDTFFILLHWNKMAGPGQLPPKINLAYPYFAVCLVSAGMINDRTVWFYIGVCLIVTWSLWFSRSRRYSPMVWAAFILIAAVIGFGGQKELRRIHMLWGDKMVEWMAGMDVDPFRAYTSIGDIGTMKLSGRILFRVGGDIKGKTPLLLRDASYSIYQQTTWVAPGTYFRSLEPEPDGTTWRLDNESSGIKSVTVLALLKHGKGILALPNRTYQIDKLPVSKLKQSNLGVVKVDEGPKLIRYRAWFGRPASLDASPGELDLKIPKKLIPVLTKISNELRLSSLSPQEMIPVVERYFEREFKYSLKLTKKFGVSAMENFFLNTKTGHCEYFATATVLLLRHAGIPARYATGYSVQEYSSLEGMYVVRDRHAHAWTLVYHDGEWTDFDTTPSTWAEIESDLAFFWEPLADLWSGMMVALKNWRMNAGEIEYRGYAAGLLLVIIGALAWKFYRKKQGRGLKIRTERKQRVVSATGADSDFYLIVERLKEMGKERYPWEPLGDWIKRIKKNEQIAMMDSLDSILALHYRFRFDPKSLSEEEKETLKSEVQNWLEPLSRMTIEQ